MQIRTATRADAEALLEIHNHFVETSTVIFDIIARTFEEQLEWIDEHSGGHPATVAVDDDGTVLGYGSLSRYRKRPAYAMTVENSVYVRPEAQGRGVGRALLVDLIDRAHAHGFHSLIARIAGDNQPSVALHSSLGFEVVGTEREVGRKFGQWLDVIIMQRLLTNEPPRRD